MAIARHGNVFIIKRPSFNATLLGRNELEAIPAMPAMPKGDSLAIQDELRLVSRLVAPNTGHLLHAGAEYRLPATSAAQRRSRARPSRRISFSRASQCRTSRLTCARLKPLKRRR